MTELQASDVTSATAENAYVYVVLSQTGTFLSRTLKILTHKEYNHASVSFDESLLSMYSFGRLRAYNPFVAGLVHESLNHGTFHRFQNANALIFRVPVSADIYEGMRNDVMGMYRHKKCHRYNHKGLFYAFFGIKKQYDDHFYCSEFVDYLFRQYGLSPFDENAIIKPMDLCELRDAEVVYRGRLQDFPPAKALRSRRCAEITI